MAITLQQSVRSLHCRSMEEVLCAFLPLPIAHELSEMTAKILRFGAKSCYMQQNGSKTLDVVGRAGPVSLFSASPKPCVIGMVICLRLA